MDCLLPSLSRRRVTAEGDRRQKKKKKQREYSLLGGGGGLVGGVSGALGGIWSGGIRVRRGRVESLGVSVHSEKRKEEKRGQGKEGQRGRDMGQTRCVDGLRSKSRARRTATGLM